MQQLWCTARQVLRILFSANQGSGSEMTFAAGATKVNLKNYKTSNDCMTWYRQQSEDISYIVMEDLINSGRNFTWAYKLKAIKSTW